jgi:PAS domain S-box-containing protein
MTRNASATHVGQSHDALGGGRRDVLAPDASLAGILDISVDAIITVDESLRIVRWNRGAQDIFGYTPDQIIGSSLDRLIPERFRAAHRRHMTAFSGVPEMARRMAERQNIFGLRRGDEEFPAEASISKMATSDGILFTVVLRDVSARKRTERNATFLVDLGAALARSLDVDATLEQATLRPVPDLADACLITLFEGPEHTMRRVVSAHQDPRVHAVLSELGRYPEPLWAEYHSPDELRDTPHRELVARVTGDWLAANAASPRAAELLSTCAPSSLMIVPLIARHRVAGVMTLLAFGARHFDRIDLELADAVALRTAFAIDTARLYETARRATQARDEVLAAVSHELRNPLSAIAMCARVLIENPPAEGSARGELLQAVAESAAWMDHLIQDLLDVVHLDAGRLSLDVQTVPLAPVMEQALAIVRGESASRRISIAQSVPRDLPLVRADPRRIVQVLANLLGNAIKFTASGGRVIVTASPIAANSDESRDIVAVSVTDTGPGIPPEELEHVFERFWRARRSTGAAGSGLGLAIAKGIVEAHGGKIWVESQLGSGSTFAFTLAQGAKV